MTDDPHENDGHAADRYDDAVSAIEAPVTELFDYSRKNRRLIRVLLVSIVFDVLLSIGTGAATAYAIHAARLASSVNKASLLACEARNDFKELDLARWRYIVDLGKDAPPTGTAAEQEAAAKRTAEFVAFIEAADAPEICN